MSKLPPETRAKSSLLANIPRLFDVSGVPEHELPTVNGHQTQSPLANAGADLSGRPKVWFVVGRGRIGKTTLIRWATETADRTDADFVSVAADPTNRSLRDFRSVAEPPANDPAETASWLLSIISALKAEKASGFVDLGGGDTALRRMLDIEPDLCETMERDGLAPVAVYVLGPDDHDLTPVAELESAGFRPPYVALVLNEAMGTPREFERITNYSTFRALQERGAVVLRMPKMVPAAMRLINAKRQTFEAASRDILHGAPVRTWLKQMEHQFSPIASWMP